MTIVDEEHCIIRLSQAMILSPSAPERFSHDDDTTKSFETVATEDSNAPTRDGVEPPIKAFTMVLEAQNDLDRRAQPDKSRCDYKHDQ